LELGPELPAPEVLLCDTSYLAHFERSLRDASRYRHWDRGALERVAAAVLAITPFTLGEIRAGYVLRNWGAARITALENRIAGYVLIPLDSDALDEYAKLHAHCIANGIGIGQNDLWIAAIAISRSMLLITCDRAQAELPGLESIYFPPP
jgi:predicted nucleic acid-binding protein